MLSNEIDLCVVVLIVALLHSSISRTGTSEAVAVMAVGWVVSEKTGADGS